MCLHPPESTQEGLPGRGHTLLFFHDVCTSFSGAPKQAPLGGGVEIGQGGHQTMTVTSSGWQPIKCLSIVSP